MKHSKCAEMRCNSQDYPHYNWKSYLLYKIVRKRRKFSFIEEGSTSFLAARNDLEKIDMYTLR